LVADAVISANSFDCLNIAKIWTSGGISGHFVKWFQKFRLPRFMHIIKKDSLESI
jgi:hypothetical protein